MTARVVPALAVAVIGTAIVVPRATAHPSTAQSVTADATDTATAAPQSVTLLWIDAATGTVTNSWSGTQAEADTLTPTPESTSGTLTELSRTGTVSPSIVKKSCTLPNSYFNVRASTLNCYAYAGEVATYITYTYQVDSGNNVGWFKYLYGGVSRQISLARWTSAVFYSRVTVTRIHIN
jgi:hypothetical protein